MNDKHPEDQPIRPEIASAIGELAELVPEMRMGQLLAAVGELCADLYGRGLWDATDAEFHEAIWQFRKSSECSPANLLKSKI